MERKGLLYGYISIVLRVLLALRHAQAWLTLRLPYFKYRDPWDTPDLREHLTSCSVAIIKYSPLVTQAATARDHATLALLCDEIMFRASACNH